MNTHEGKSHRGVSMVIKGVLQCRGIVNSEGPHRIGVGRRRHCRIGGTGRGGTRDIKELQGAHARAARRVAAMLAGRQLHIG